MKEQNSFALLVCGGTLDKDYQPKSGELGFTQTHLPEILAQSLVTLPHRLEVVMLKDSLEMDETDREALFQACLQAKENQIVITHGTDTMTKSGEYLLAKLTDLSGKTIVLTGAMRPFKLGNSDSQFNLGAAFLAAQLAEPGVYICMNGQLFPADKVSKNLDLGLFEPIATKTSTPANSQ